MIYGTEEFSRQLKLIIKDGARHPLYQPSVEHAKAMAVHVDGDKPVFLLDRARPREDAEVKAYRLENYEPTTKSSSDKALDILSKMFNPTLYSINWNDKDQGSKQLETYLMEEYPVNISVVNFDKDVLLRKMVSDPNAVIVIQPERIPQTDAERVNPKSFIYGSCNVWWYDNDCYIIFLRKEQDENRQEYYYFYYFDSQYFISFRGWWDESNRLLNYEDVDRPYRHGAGAIPAWHLQGKQKNTDDGLILYESWFSSALPQWNQAVNHESDLLGAYINHMHPQKYEMAEECNHKYQYQGQGYPCRMGEVNFPGGKDGATATITCPGCGGSGYNAVKSPYGVYQFNKKKLEDAGSTSLVPVGYISIPVDATKMLEERTEKLRRQGMWALNMDVEDKVGENQSGVAKVIDRSAQHDFIFRVSSVMFDVHLKQQIKFTNIYLFNSEDKTNLPQINKPTQFDILTTAELMNNFALAAKSGADKNYLRIKAIEIANRDLANSPAIKDYLITILEIDPLYGLPQEEISTGVSNGVIRKVDWAVHENIKPFVDRAIEENSTFLSMDLADKKEIVEKYGEELVKASKPQIDPVIMNPMPDDVAA